VCVFCFLSPLVWFFLWLPEEVLALLFLLHCENGDFSIRMKDIFFGTFTVQVPVIPLRIHLLRSSTKTNGLYHG
jgi:hypothetical protein